MAWSEIQNDPFASSSRTYSLGTQSQRTTMSRKSSKEVMGLSNQSRKPSRFWASSEKNTTYSSERAFYGGPDEFFHALSPEVDVPVHELRMRSSSASLGRLTNAQRVSNVSPPPKLPQLRKSGSWSNFTFPEPVDEPPSSTLGLSIDTNPRRGSLKSSSSEGPRTGAKSPPTKRNPGRLDLSNLFPKPKGNTAPLISPQQYANSPSSASDFSVGKTRRSGNKLTKQPPPFVTVDRGSRLNSVAPHPPSTVSIISPQSVPRIVSPPVSEAAPSLQGDPKRRTMEWFDLPLEKVMRFDHEPINLDGDFSDAEVKRSDQSLLAPPTPAADGLVSSTSSSPSFGHSEDPGSPTETVSRDTIRLSKLSDISQKRLTLESATSHKSHVSPTPRAPFSSHIRNSLDTWQFESENEPQMTRATRSVRSKSPSSRALFTSDLTKSSVLSLSSSEDEYEGDDNDDDAFGFDNEVVQPPKRHPTSRNSVATYDYNEPEICTAEAIVPPRHTSMARVDHGLSVGTNATRRVQHPQTLSRNTSSASSVASSRQFRSSPMAKPDQSRLMSTKNRPIGVTRSASGKRRSRIIAVTRQEETLLEAMRQRNGRFTPSMLLDLKGDNSEPEPTSNASVSTPQSARSFESVLNGDKSFLRLSGMPPVPETTVADIRQKFHLEVKDNGGDSETSSNYPQPSPRGSVLSEDNRSSPSDGLASPVTPTIPLHHLPPQSAPPLHALPPVPDSARHSRRRTDSSGALVLSDAGDEKRDDAHEFPLWAVKWSRNAADMTIVH